MTKPHQATHLVGINVRSAWLKRIINVLLIASLLLEIPYVLYELHIIDLLGWPGQLLFDATDWPLLFAALTGLRLIISLVPFLGSMSAFILALLNRENNKLKFALLLIGILLFADSIRLLLLLWPPIGSPVSI